MLGHYLMFNRNCKKAIETYEKAFGAQIIEMQKYGDMPPNPAFPVPEEDKELVLHAKLIVDGMEIMCADSSSAIEGSNNMYISITTKDSGLVERAWDVLKQEGKIYMELQASFFASLHGSLQDKYNINWMFTVLK